MSSSQPGIPASAPDESIRAQVLLAIKNQPAPHPLCASVLSQIANPNADYKVLAQTAQYDPGMTAGVLKLANSSLFGTARAIDSFQAACVRLGMKKLLDMVVATTMPELLKRGIEGYAMGHDDLLKHSVWVAVAAEELARSLGIKRQDMLFTVGLLHDTGKLITGPFVKKHFSAADYERHQKGMAFDATELATLGIGHAEAGALMLDGWHFPEEIVTAVRCHHEPEHAGPYRSTASLIHVADILAYCIGAGDGLDSFQYHVSADCVARMKLNAAAIEGVACRVFDRMKGLNELLGIDC